METQPPRDDSPSAAGYSGVPGSAEICPVALENLTDGILITTAELNEPHPQIIFANDAICRMTGYTAAELIGQTPRILQGPLTDRRTLDRIRADLMARQCSAVELVNYRKDGTTFDVQLFIAPCINQQGECTHFVAVQRDLTPSHRIERERALLAAIVQHSEDAIVAMNLDGTIEFWNAGAERLYGRRAAEVTGSLIGEAVNHDTANILAMIERLRQGERSASMETTLPGADSRGVDVAIKMSPIKGPRGEVVGVSLIARDITQRKAAETARWESEQRIRAILNAAADAIVTINRHGMILRVNRATEQMFGYNEADMIGQPIGMLMPSPYREEHDHYLARYLEHRVPRVIGIGREVVGRRRDGSVFPADLSVSEIDHMGVFTGILRDISERKQLQAQVLEVAADEQRRIGQELHDSIGQELTGLSLFAGTLVHILDETPQPPSDGHPWWRFTPDEFARLRRSAERLSRGLDEANQHVHQLSHGIMPVQVDADGLRSALEDLAATTDAHEGICCEFVCEGRVQVEDNTTATHLYRIGQEAVANALRHGRASSISIGLSEDAGQVVLEVRDNGIGLPSEALHARPTPQGGMGLRIMDYRAGVIGGLLQFQSNIPQGTVVRCIILPHKELSDERPAEG